MQSPVKVTLIVWSLWGHNRPSCNNFKIVKTGCHRLITNIIPKSIMGSSFSVFAVSNMDRMAKLTIKWLLRAVLWIAEQGQLASNWLSCCGTVFKESYLLAMFDLECEKVW